MSDLARTSEFQMSISSSLTKIAQCVEFTHDSSKEDIDITDLDSSGREFLPGLRDEGTVSLTLLMDPDGTTWQAITDEYQLHSTQSFRMAWSDGTNCDFTGYINGISQAAVTGDALRATVSVKVAQPITYPT